VNVSARGDGNIYSGIGNVYYDFTLSDGTTRPYVGAGVGYGRVDLDSITVPGVGTYSAGHDSGVAWQATVGVGFELVENTYIVPSYRFMRIETNPSFETHVLMVGLRQSFQ
jgi:opacity protein-like surface antigen